MTDISSEQRAKLRQYAKDHGIAEEKITLDKLSELLEAAVSIGVTRYGTQHGLAQEKIDELVMEIAKAIREGAETGKSDEEMITVFSDILKKYGLPDAEIFKVKDG